MEEIKTMNEVNNNERFPLVCNGKAFGAKYNIDTNGNLWDALTGDEIAWQREAIADLSKSSTVRTETAGKRKFSKLVAEDGTLVTVGRAEAVAWSVPQVAAGHKSGTVVVFKDGDMSNEVAANLSWGSPHERLEKNRAGGKTGTSSSQILSDEDVREILISYNPYDAGNNSRALADRFGVAQTTINNVVSFKTFPHVDRKPFASNPHVKQENYFDSYVPGEGTVLYERYVKMGKIVPNKTIIATESAPMPAAIPEANPITITETAPETVAAVELPGYGIFNPDDELFDSDPLSFDDTQDIRQE